MRRVIGSDGGVGASLQGAGQAASGGFWAEHGDAILVAVVTAVLVLVARKPVEALLARLGRWLRHRLEGLGFRFRRRYLEALADQHRWLRLIGLYSRTEIHPPRLREVYISLRLAASGGDDGPRLAWHRALGQRGGRKHRIAILGAPGAGKTTLLDYLVLVFTGRVAHPLREQLGRPFPLYARLRELGADAPRSTLLGLLGATAPLGRLPGDFPERWLERGGSIVLLDGLDEVLDERRHQRAVEEIERLVADYPDNHLVVTCRVAGWQGQLPGFATYEIQELDDDDIRRFAGAWYREALRTERVRRLGADPAPERVREAEAEAAEEARRQAEDLWRQLATNPGLLRVARTPLILSLILLLHHLRVTELPEGRAELYRRCLEVLLEVWDAKEKRLALPDGLRLTDKLRVLRTVAWHFLEEDLLEARLEDLERVVEPLLGRLAATGTSAGEVIRRIEKRSGILVEQALGRYGFAHRALADYLAADHVVEHELDERLLAGVGHERWREVTLLAVGLAPPGRAERLVRGLLEQGVRSPAALEMAGLSLREEVHLGEELEAEVLERLRRRLESETSGALFARLVAALMAADLERAREWMADVLRGRDPGLRSRVLELLPELGTEHGETLTPLLGSLLGDPALEVPLRAGAARALAGVGSEVDGASWEALAGARESEDLDLRAAATWAWCELGRFEELGLVRVPAGEFRMGSAEFEGHPREHPQHNLFLPTFYIGRYPVTVGQWRRYLGHAGREPANALCLAAPEDHPVTSVSWHEALAYARWHGGTLPSEAEWEKAARGTDGRRYPWGDGWQPDRANTRESWGRTELRDWVARRVGRRRPRRTTAVGFFSPGGDSPYGCADMAGNVWEWTRNLWGELLGSPELRYPYAPGDDREELGAPDDVVRVLRGGSWLNGAVEARCAARLGNHPHDRDRPIGFRFAVSPPTSAPPSPVRAE